MAFDSPGFISCLQVCISIDHKQLSILHQLFACMVLKCASIHLYLQTSQIKKLQDINLCYIFYLHALNNHTFAGQLSHKEDEEHGASHFVSGLSTMDISWATITEGGNSGCAIFTYRTESRD